MRTDCAVDGIWWGFDARFDPPGMYGMGVGCHGGWFEFGRKKSFPLGGKSEIQMGAGIS